MAAVLVLVDRHVVDSSVRHGACALLTIARRIGTPTAVLCGQPDATSIALLGEYGAEAICAVSASEVDEFPVAARVEALVQLAERTSASSILMASGYAGYEIAAAVAVRLDCGVVTDAVDLRWEPDGPVAVQQVLAGTHVVESSVVRGITVCTVRTQAVTAVPAPADPVVRQVNLTFPAKLRGARLVSRTARPAAPSDLSTAAVVVAGGRGVGSHACFGLVERIAGELGGAACGSHTAATLGWCAPDRRVDQIGTVVHPRLYLAMGVSGSVRHRAGMQDAKTIVAIDRDPHAPIFDVADFGVIGDLHEVVPAVLAEIHRRKRSDSTEA